MMLAVLSMAGLWLKVQPSRVQARGHTFQEFLAGQVGKTVESFEWTAKIIEVKSDYVVLQVLKFGAKCSATPYGDLPAPGTKIVHPISRIERVLILKEGRMFWMAPC
jgi:hypothetical protein